MKKISMETFARVFFVTKWFYLHSHVEKKRQKKKEREKNDRQKKEKKNKKKKKKKQFFFGVSFSKEMRNSLLSQVFIIVG